MHLQKIILEKKKSYFQKELAKNRNKPKELWKMHTGMILVNLQKAYDTLDHGVLLEKMKYFGFQTSAIK